MALQPFQTPISSSVLVLDIENIWYWLRAWVTGTSQNGQGSQRHQAECQELLFGTIRDAVAKFEPTRSYCMGDFERLRIGGLQNLLFQLGVDVVHVDGTIKESADQALTITVMDDYYTKSRFDALTLISGDGGFLHLARYLRKRGVQTIVSGWTHHHVSTLLGEENTFIPLEEILSQANRGVWDRLNSIRTGYVEEQHNSRTFAPPLRPILDEDDIMWTMISILVQRKDYAEIFLGPVLRQLERDCGRQVYLDERQELVAEMKKCGIIDVEQKPNQKGQGFYTVLYLNRQHPLIKEMIGE